jgi:DnaJ homolog subfamily A member 2
MSAFAPGGSSNAAGDFDMEDLMQQFYGSMFAGGPGGPGMGGANFSFGASGFSGAPPGVRRKNQMQEYSITMEEAFKGKTVKFSSTKNGSSTPQTKT